MQYNRIEIVDCGVIGCGHYVCHVTRMARLEDRSDLIEVDHILGAGPGSIVMDYYWSRVEYEWYYTCWTHMHGRLQMRYSLTSWYYQLGVLFTWRTYTWDIIPPIRANMMVNLNHFALALEASRNQSGSRRGRRRNN